MPTPTSTRTPNCRVFEQQLCLPSASWTNMYTRTAHEVCSHTNHSITSAQVAADFELTLASLILMRKESLFYFFCFKEVKANCAIRLDRNTLSTLYFCVEYE